MSTNVLLTLFCTLLRPFWGNLGVCPRRGFSQTKIPCRTCQEINAGPVVQTKASKGALSCSGLNLLLQFSGCFKHALH
eukprot:6471569-Amphidinium_carterae.1